MPHQTWGRDVSNLMKWVFAESTIKPNRVYPASGEAIMVMTTPGDRKKVLELNGKQFNSHPITFRNMSESEYLTLRNSGYEPGDKWTWKVRFDDEEFKDNDIEHPSLSDHPIFGKYQMHHPQTGHAMCIACMNPLNPGEFNVCSMCCSGIARPMWMP
jgi:hypothetical protein